MTSTANFVRLCRRDRSQDPNV